MFVVMSINTKKHLKNELVNDKWLNIILNSEKLKAFLKDREQDRDAHSPHCYLT